MKKKIIFFSTPAFGHINSVYPVLERLVKNGYEVDWYCSKRFKDFVESSGANFIEYFSDFDQYVLSDLTENFYNLYKGILRLNKECYLEYINIVRKEKPDLILYDSMCSFAKNISKQVGIQSVCLCTTMAYNMFTFVFSNMFFSTIKLVVKNFKPILQLYKDEKKFRKEHHLNKVKVLDLFVNSGDLTFVFTPKELQPFWRTFPKSFHFVGTTIKDRILNRKQYEKYDVYISLGSIFTENTTLLNQIAESEILKGKKSIVTIGNAKIENRPNVEFVKSTEQLSLLPQIDFFINHGGLNSIYESLYFGKFQICIPQQEEQRMSSIIFHRKKLAYYVKKFEDIKEDKRKHYQEKNKKYIERYQKIIQGYDGTEMVFRSIDRLLRNDI